MKRKVHNNDRLDRRLILNEKSPFALRESYRSVFTNLIYLPLDTPCKRFAMISSVSGEGKTSTAINLALTLIANTDGARVLLIDADLHAPRISRLLDISSEEHGFSEYLARIDAQPHICTPKDYPGLSVLTSGKITENSSALFTPSRLQDLAAYCDEHYDYVIVDTPPLNLLSDALLLKNFVNGYLLVARCDYSDVNSIGASIESVRSIGAEIYGTVLTCVQYKKGSHYGHYGTYGYGIYNQRVDNPTTIEQK